MIFRKKKKSSSTNALEYPSYDEFESWVESIILCFDLKKGSFTFIAAYGGIILYLKNQGIIWIPYTKIKAILKTVNKGQFVHSTALIGSLAVAIPANFSLLPIILIDRSIVGFYNIYSNAPPSDIHSFLSGLIKKIVLKKIKLKPFSKIGLASPHKNAVKSQTSLQIEIQLRFFDEIKLTKLERFSDELKSFFFGNKKPKFVIPILPGLPSFLALLEKDGAEIEFDGITLDELKPEEKMLEK